MAACLKHCLLGAVMTRPSVNCVVLELPVLYEL